MAIKLITSVSGAGIGFFYGGPAGAVAGIAAGAWIGNQFRKARNTPEIITKEAMQNLNASEQAFVQEIQKTIDAAEALHEKNDKLLASIYLCSLGVSLASTQAQRNFDWYELNCREANISGGEEILCYAGLGVGCIALTISGIAILSLWRYFLYSPKNNIIVPETPTTV